MYHVKSEGRVEIRETQQRERESEEGAVTGAMVETREQRE